MKFFRSPLSVLLIILSLSCSTNNLDEDTNTIIGNWKLISLKLEHEYDFNNDDIYSNDLFDESDCWRNTILIFNEDGTGILNSGYTFSITASGYFACYEIDSTVFDWTQEDDIIIVDFGNLRSRYAIQGKQLTTVTPMNEIAEMIIGPNETDNLTSVYIKQ
ncbi:DUF5004 domain-containing protein [Pontimicrobium aquaticum]|uniref:DUF5004 domain-containing protein n=1 Tax=Pontimicrobium aquaticum TaxID=2565367 RepID=A0A4U0EYN0_9FLAO|nr:DUF5004 domain-containing protein [Pontimicrobium aquaticum]TJY37008.1 DUF5004 domain-containing protein [Pontimicrobium aquaticum]